MVKALILRCAGTNCNDEIELGLTMTGCQTEQVHIKKIIDSQFKLADYDLLVLPGGFSYGDYIGAGKILANELKHKLNKHLNDFIKSGKIVLGICNGFQTLVASGYLPGNGLKAGLSNNISGKFECRWITLKGTHKLTKGINTLQLPVAHGEGRFIASEKTLNLLEKNGQILYYYSSSKYPENPNGSMRNIAGITNKAGNVIGLMPHPERNVRCQNHPTWTRENHEKCEDAQGLKLLKNIIGGIK